MATPQQSFAWYISSDGLLTINISPPAPVGGRSLQWSVLNQQYGISGLIQKYLSSGYNGASGISILNSGQGVLNIHINGSDTSGWQAGCYFHQLVATDSGLSVTMLTGNFLLR